MTGHRLALAGLGVAAVLGAATVVATRPADAPVLPAVQRGIDAGQNGSPVPHVGPNR